MNNKKERILKMTDQLLGWYPSHARELPWRKDQEPYHVWLSEIMLQQTRVEAVKDYYHRFLITLPKISDLAEVPDDRLLKLWEGLGYYNRARNLKKAAKVVMEDFGGKFPETYEEILSLPGIGEYTAGAIASICFDVPVPAVDGNVLRVYTRVMEDNSVIDKQSTKKAVAEALVPAYQSVSRAGKQSGNCGMLTQSLMELGATICVPNGAPDCSDCPLKNICQARAHDSWEKFPVRQEKKGRQLVDMTVFVLRYENKIAIRKRQQKGLLHGMWELPNVESILVEQQAADQATDWEVVPEHLQMKHRYTHIFTHKEWRMTAYYLSCLQMSGEFEWVTMEELEKDKAVPSAFRPFIELLRKDEGK